MTEQEKRRQDIENAWFLESTVALKKTAIYYGIPKYGHKNCYRKAGEFFLVDQVDRTEPDIEKKCCSACGKPLIQEQSKIMKATLHREKAQLLADIATAQAHITALLERPLDAQDWQAEQVYSNLADGMARAHARIAEIDAELAHGSDCNAVL